jgi:DNA invertase Pin-like site-specific DNA recombinase
VAARSSGSGRSLPHLIETVSTLEQRGVGFRSLTENLDTTTAGGRLVFHLFGALAQFERDIIRERTMAGLQAVATRGRKGGRPKAMDGVRIEAARRLLDRACRSRTSPPRSLSASVRSIAIAWPVRQPGHRAE